MFVVNVNGPSGAVYPHPFASQADAQHYLAECQANGWSGSIQQEVAA